MSETIPVALEPRHDFVAKLKGPALLPAVRLYVEWRRAVLLARKNGTPEPEMPSGLVPPAIQLDLTTACNSECPGCIDKDILNSIQAHAYEKLLESLQHMIDRGLCSVILIGGGEPTIHPKFADCVGFLKDRGVQVGIVSNGLYSKPILDVAERLTPPDWVRISLDAGSDPTFQALRRPRHRITLEEVCAGVTRIHERNPTLRIGYSFVVSWPDTTTDTGEVIAENMHEMALAAELARRSGFGYISFKAYLTRAMTGSEVIEPETIRDYEATIERIRENLAEAKKLEVPRFEVSVSKNLRAMMEGTWQNFMDQPRTCGKIILESVFTPLGTFHCSSYRGQSKARVGDSDLFSVSKRHEGRKALARMLDTFDAHAECAKTVCFYNDMNWWLEDLVEGRAILPLEGIPGADCFL